MKKLLLTLCIGIFVSSCDKETPDPVIPVNPSTNPISNYVAEFYIDGVKYTGVNNSITVMKFPGEENYQFSLGMMTENQMTNNTRTLSVSIDDDFKIEPGTYYFPNNADFMDPNMGNDFSYMIGTSTVYNNIYCDEVFQGGTDHGEAGSLQITSIDPITKKISGTFSMSICKGQGEFIDVTGHITNMNFILQQ